MSGDGSSLNRMTGDPKVAIRSMVGPLFIALAIVNVNQFADIFWISGLGVEPSEAVSTMAPVYGLISCIGIGVGVGATATMSFRLGRGEFREAGRLAGGSMLLGTILALVSSVTIWILMDPLIMITGATEIRELCIGYILPMLLLSPAIVLEAIVGGMLRAEGAAKRSTIMQILAAGLNMVIDPVLIYGLSMGVSGAGLATASAALISLIAGLTWYVRRRMEVQIRMPTRITVKRDLREVADVAIPRSAESLVSNVSDIIQRVFLAVAGGSTAIVLYNYPWRYISLANLPASAMDNAMIPVCSAAYGAGNHGKMAEGFRYTLKTILVCSSALAVIMFVLADPLISILTYEEGVAVLRPDLVWVLRMSAIVVPFSALMGLGSAMMQSMKRSRLSMHLYLVWGAAKLALYAAVCTISFEAIILCMIVIHVIGGLMMAGVAWRELSNLRNTEGMS